MTDVRTPSQDLWQHNPYLTPLSEEDPAVEQLLCHYPLIHRSNQEPVHFLHGFSEYLSERLGVRIKPQAFKADIHLSNEEKAEDPLVHRLTGDKSPYWIMVAGGKFDFTAKWWATERYQAVAGGREPPHWEAYPGHRYLNTIGLLRCCQSGGCWRSRVKPLGDGSRKDQPGDLCVDVVGDLPRCMDMITAEDVIREVERFLPMWK